MSKGTLAACVLFVALGLTGCVSRPQGFATTLENSWASIELRDDLSYENAWKDCLLILAKAYDIKTISKADGLLQTDWTPWVTSGGRGTGEDCKVMLIFSLDGKVLQFHMLARLRDQQGFYTYGVDNEAVSLLKTDLMGVVGRVTR